jgi:hypothetical protein
VSLARRCLVFGCAVLAVAAVLVVLSPSREGDKSNPSTPSRSILAGDNPRSILKAAIEAHGGEENLARTLTGVLLAKASLTLPPDVESTISFEETLELPRRYKRVIRGELNGKDFTMEYAVTDGSGWTRQNGGKVREFHGQPSPLSSRWEAMLALLPSLLKDDFKLASGGEEKVGGRELVGVKASGEDIDYTLFFDRQSGLLVKSKWRMEHPLSGEEVDAEGAFGDYKNVSGIQYPMRVATYSDGKKIIELRITRIEFLKKIDDRVFDKP